MNKDEIKDLLAKLKRGELCTPNCYGCCGDNELDFAYCPDVADNFEKELANLGYRQIADDEIVLNKKDYEKLCHLAYFGYEDVKQETARAILKEILKEVESMEVRANLQRKTVKVEELKSYCDWIIHKVVPKTIKDFAEKHGIELEEEK